MVKVLNSKSMSKSRMGAHKKSSEENSILISNICSCRSQKIHLKLKIEPITLSQKVKSGMNEMYTILHICGF